MYNIIIRSHNIPSNGIYNYLLVWCVRVMILLCGEPHLRDGLRTRLKFTTDFIKEHARQYILHVSVKYFPCVCQIISMCRHIRYTRHVYVCIHGTTSNPIRGVQDNHFQLRYYKTEVGGECLPTCGVVVDRLVIHWQDTNRMNNELILVMSEGLLYCTWMFGFNEYKKGETRWSYARYTIIIFNSE